MRKEIDDFVNSIDVNDNNYNNVMNMLKILSFDENLSREKEIEFLDELINDPKVKILLRKIFYQNIKSKNKDKFLASIEDSERLINLLEMYADSIGESIYDDLSNSELVSLEDSTKKYLNEISRYEILPRDIEYSLAVLASDKSSDNDKNEARKLLRSTSYKLSVLNAKDEEEEKKNARKDMVNHNLRFVVYLSKKYVNKGVDFLDLIQNGNLGMMKASERYDYNFGYKFSTYATWWIRQAILSELNINSKVIKRPASFEKKIVEYQRVCAEFARQYDRMPNNEEALEALGSNWGTANTLFLVQRTLGDLVSLSQPVGDDEDSTLEDFIQDESSLSVEAESEKKFVSEQVNILLDNAVKFGKLNELQIYVIKAHNGLLGKIISYEKLAKELGVSPTKVKSIEFVSFKILKRYIYENLDVCFIKNEGRDENDEHQKTEGIINKNLSSYSEEERENILKRISDMFGINYRGI